MGDTDQFTMLNQAGADVPIPKKLSPEYRDVLNTVIKAQQILNSVGGNYGLQLWIIPRAEFEEEFPTLDFIVRGFTKVSLSLKPAENQQGGFVWNHETMNMGGHVITNLPVFNSPWSLIFQILWLTQELVEGCTEFIGQEVRTSEDFNVIGRIRNLIASGMLPTDDEITLWAAKTYLTNTWEEEEEEYELDNNDEIELESEEPEDECINDGDCSGSCDSCSRVRAQQKNTNITGYYGAPDPTEPFCGLPSSQ